MSATVEFDALEKLVRPLSRHLSGELARALVNVEPDPEVQGRFESLADRNTEGTLTSDERLELEALVRANTFLQVLKLEARVALAEAPAA